MSIVDLVNCTVIFSSLLFFAGPIVFLEGLPVTIKSLNHIANTATSWYSENEK